MILGATCGPARINVFELIGALLAVASGCATPPAAPQPGLASGGAGGERAAPVFCPEEGSGGAPANASPYGLFHLPNVIDATALYVDESSGTFRWVIDGCDFGGGSDGMWKMDGGILHLLPKPGTTSFLWDDGVGYKTETIELAVSPDAQAGRIVVKGVVAGAPLEQTWESGGVCALCCARSRQRPCDDPGGIVGTGTRGTRADLGLQEIAR